MPEVTFDTIAPLVQDSQVSARTIQVTFKCPATGTIVTSSAAVQKGTAVADVALHSARRSALYSLRASVFSAIRGALGYGLLGRVGQDVASSLLTGAERKASEHISEGQRKAAILEAFERVRTEFAWDPKGGRWVSTKGAGDIISSFDRQLAGAPVETLYDRSILARMLVEVAAADGHIAEEEREFIGQVISEDLGTVDDLINKGTVSSAELEETSEGPVRETMLMLSFGLALTDEDLAEEEQTKLTAYAEGLGLTKSRAEEIKRIAQSHLLERAADSMYKDGPISADTRQALLELGQKLGLDPAAAEKVEIRYRKVRGLV